MQRKLLVVSILIYATSLFSQTMDNASQFSKSFKPLWDRTSTYLLEVAEAMPDSLYQYKATGEVFTFEEQMLHLTDNMYWLSTDKIMEQPYERVKSGGNPLGKEAVLKRVKNAITYVSETIEHFDESRLHDTLTFGGAEIDKERLFYLIRDHITHHRAQAIIYLRLNGIKPPRYVGW